MGATLPPTISKADAARRLHVSAATITRWTQAKKLPTIDGRIPEHIILELERQTHAYASQHGDTARAIELMTERLGAEMGLTHRRALEVAAELCDVGSAWNKRIAEGAPPEAVSELRETFAARLSLLGIVAQRAAQLTALATLGQSLLPATPRRELLRLSVFVGQQDPDQAAAIIEQMDDETVAAKLTELQDMMHARPDANAHEAPTGAEENA